MGGLPHGEEILSEVKALFLAYYFPPFGGGGVQRTTKYAKYLPSYGWEPVVVTIEENLVALRDESLAKDLPLGLEVMRTNAWGLGIEHLLKRKAVQIPQGSGSASPTPEADSLTPEADSPTAKADSPAPQANLSTAAAASSPKNSFLRRVQRRVRQVAKSLFLFAYTFMLYPDDRIGWYPFALKVAKERLQKGDIDLIYTTSAPFTAHLLGLRLKRLTGKPWVADFRDPWTGNEYLNFKRLRRPLDRFFEWRCIHHADRVITVSKPLLEDLWRRYPQEPRDKFQMILNGYDEADLAAIPGGLPPDHSSTAQPSRFCTFTYAGSFYQGITPRYFLQALDGLLSRGKLNPQDIRIRFLGQFGAESRERISEFQARHPAVMEVLGYLPHQEAVAAMCLADVLLLFLNKEAGRGVLTQKLFEYLGSGNPILGMLPEGDAAQMIRKARAGIAVSPENVTMIQEAVLRLVQAWQEGTLAGQTDEDYIKQFSRKALAGELAQVFNTLKGVNPC